MNPTAEVQWSQCGACGACTTCAACDFVCGFWFLPGNSIAAGFLVGGALLALLA